LSLSAAVMTDAVLLTSDMIVLEDTDREDKIFGDETLSAGEEALFFLFVGGSTGDVMEFLLRFRDGTVSHSPLVSGVLIFYEVERVKGGVFPPPLDFPKTRRFCNTAQRVSYRKNGNYVAR